MYKNILISIIFLISAESLSSQEFYRSNSTGMALERISAIRMDEAEYLLEISLKGNVRYRKLYKKGNLLKTWEIYYNRAGEQEKETVDENGEKTEYYYSGRSLKEEIFYRDNKFQGKNIYIYSSDGTLREVENYSSDGALYSRKSYSQTGEWVTSVLDDNKTEDDVQSLYSFSGTDLRSEWQGHPDGTGTFFYYNDGRIAYTEKWDSEKALSRTDYFYSDKKLMKTVEKSYSDNREITCNYDERKRVVSETEKYNDNTVRTVYNTYDNDNIIKKIVKSDKDTEKYIYNYNDSELAVELYYLNGSLMKKTVYEESEGNYFEDLYSDNIKYMRIYYRDNEKYKTEK